MHPFLFILLSCVQIRYIYIRAQLFLYPCVMYEYNIWKLVALVLCSNTIYIYAVITFYTLERVQIDLICLRKGSLRS